MSYLNNKTNCLHQKPVKINKQYQIMKGACVQFPEDSAHSTYYASVNQHKNISLDINYNLSNLYLLHNKPIGILFNKIDLSKLHLVTISFERQFCGHKQ